MEDAGKRRVGCIRHLTSLIHHVKQPVSPAGPRKELIMPVYRIRMAAVVTGLLTITALVTAQAPQVPASSIPGITNYTRVDATVGCGGATAVDAFPALKREGFTAVINLRRAEEPGANIDESRSAAERAGLKYIHLPFDGHAPSPAVADAFLAAVTDPSNAPVYIHCAAAGRVGAVWLIKRVLVDGWDIERATTEAKRIGLRSPQLEQFARDYIAAHQR
jgi:uncharacterized protein (TIGR01244 family)